MLGQEKGLALAGRNISCIAFLCGAMSFASETGRGDRLQKRNDVSIRFLYVLSNMYSMRYPSTLFSFPHCPSRPSDIDRNFSCTEHVWNESSIS